MIPYRGGMSGHQLDWVDQEGNVMQGLLRRYLQHILEGEVNWRLKAQLQVLEAGQSRLYLDCGCHAGYNAMRLAARIGTQRVVGADYYERLLAGARARGLAALRCDINKPLPFCDGAFDIVTALDVIEHIVETALFVQELYRVIAPGGYLILDTPNLASWHNIFALVLGIQPFSRPNITTMLDADLGVVQAMHRHDRQFDEDGEVDDRDEPELRRHFVVLAYRSAVNLLRREGSVVEQALGFGYIPFPPPLAGLLAFIDPAHAHHMLIKVRKPER